MERWGSAGDGGYVVPADLLQNVDVLITGGVSNDVHFEEDLARKNPKAKIGLFDHTIAAAPDHAPVRAVWHKLGLGSSPMCVSLEEAAKLSGAGPNDVLAVKFDIEFAEWELLESTPTAFWDRVAVLITEYHCFDKRENWDRYKSALQRLERAMLPVHIHANNYASTIRLDTEGVEFPITIEGTYINRRFVAPDLKVRPWKHAGPTKLDARNKWFFLDIRLNYWGPRKDPISTLARRIGSIIFTWRVRKNIVFNLRNILPKSLRPKERLS